MAKTKPVKEAYIFLGLTLGLSYFVFWGPLAVFGVTAVSFVDHTRGPAWAIALFLLGGFVPSLTGIYLTWTNEGREGLKRLWSRVVRYKIGWRWYLSALLIIIIGTAGQLGIMQLLDLPFEAILFITQLGSFLPLLILGPLSEEIGWRGYALDRLQTKWNALTSSLIIGVVWALWHAPLFVMAGTSQHELRIPFIGFAMGVTASSIVYTWLHNNTRGSIWTAIFFHWIGTYASQVVATGVTRSPLYNWLEFVPYVIIALIIVTAWKPKSRSEID